MNDHIDHNVPRTETRESQLIQMFDGTTLSDPIPTQNPAKIHHDRIPSRLSRFKRNNLKPQNQAQGGSMTITWFNSLNWRDPSLQVDFPESLLMITESGSTVGKYYCSVKKSILIEDPCALVHFGSCSTMMDGLECGISVTGFVDDNLQTIQEYTHEWMKYQGKSIDRKFVLMRELDKNQYFCKNTIWENGVVREERNFTVDIHEMKHVISESATVILQRIMVQQKKTGQIELKALTAKGDVVRSCFRALGEGVENIRGEEMNVQGLRRTIFDVKNVEEWDSIFNEHGRMVLRCQPDKDHALIPLWFKPVEKYSTTGEFVGTRPPLVWACDMEMYAQYLERKDLLVSMNKNYLLKHPTVKAMLADFLQALLQKKPKKVVEFGMQFFEPFLHRRPELDLCLSDTDSDKQDEDEDFEVVYSEQKLNESETNLQGDHLKKKDELDQTEPDHTEEEEYPPTDATQHDTEDGWASEAEEMHVLSEHEPIYFGPENDPNNYQQYNHSEIQPNANEFPAQNNYNEYPPQHNYDEYQPQNTGPFDSQPLWDPNAVHDPTQQQM